MATYTQKIKEEAIKAAKKEQEAAANAFTKQLEDYKTAGNRLISDMETYRERRRKWLF